MAGTSKKNSDDLERNENFRRVTAATLRAVGGRPETEVAFANNASARDAQRTAEVRLPYLSRAMPPAEVARIRGAADAAP